MEARLQIGQKKGGGAEGKREEERKENGEKERKEWDKEDRSRGVTELTRGALQENLGTGTGDLGETKAEGSGSLFSEFSSISSVSCLSSRPIHSPGKLGASTQLSLEASGTSLHRLRRPKFDPACLVLVTTQPVPLTN